MEVAKAENEPFNQIKLENWKTLSKELVLASDQGEIGLNSHEMSWPFLTNRL